MTFDYNENDAMELRILANPTICILMSQQHITMVQSRSTTAICDGRFSCQIITCSGCQLPSTALWFCFIINLFNKHVQMLNAKKWRMLLYNQYSLEINQLISSRLFTISHHVNGNDNIRECSTKKGTVTRLCCEITLLHCLNKFDGNELR